MLTEVADTQADTSTALVPVPNGTAALVATGVSRLDELVEQYRMFAKKSAEAILDLAETVFIADRDLVDKTDLQEFCKRVGLNRKGSTYRKMRIVGRTRSRFEPFLDRLPKGWTTLAKLASLQPDQFDRVTKDERFGSTLTGGDVNQIVGHKSSKRARGVHGGSVIYDCIVQFDGLVDMEMRRKAYDELIAYSEKWGLKCIPRPDFEETLGQFVYGAA